MSRKQKKQLYRIIATVLLFAVAVIIDNVFIKNIKIFTLLVYLVPYLIIGFDVLRKSFLNILRGQVFDENFLMTIATLGAFGIGSRYTAKHRRVQLFDKKQKLISELIEENPHKESIPEDNFNVNINGDIL